jgi:hypothetical protein
MIIPLVVYFHFILPNDDKAYVLLSLDPTYTVPSDTIAGLDSTAPPVVYFHVILPNVDDKAYTLLSLDPTYTVPSDPIAGLDFT